MNRPILQGLLIVTVLQALCVRSFSRPMSAEVRARIQAEVDSVRESLKQHEGASEKMRFLRLTYQKTDSPYVKREVLEIVAGLDTPELEPFLIRVVQKDSDVRLRMIAVGKLAKHGTATAVEPLLNCAENDPVGQAGWDCIRYRTTARRKAYFALAEIGLRHPAARESVAKAVAKLRVTADELNDPKAQALYILTRDKDLVKPFFERLKDSDPKTRVRGVVAFRFLKLTRAPAELVELTDDPSRDVRSWVALVLGEIEDPETIPILIETAKDRQEDRGVRCNAIGSLGRMRAKQAEARMKELLDDESVKVNAAIALSKITGKRHPLVPEGYRLD